MRIIDYVLVEGSNKEELMVEVKEKLKENYKPQGGVAYYYSDKDDWESYTQAMIQESL